jgi:hypothetical protein
VIRLATEVAQLRADFDRLLALLARAAGEEEAAVPRPRPRKGKAKRRST